MNNVNLIGRLTRDPELRILNGGTTLCQFTLAVDKNLSRAKKQEFEASGKPTADFIRIVTWDKQAEHCKNYLRKGSKAAVQGRITTSVSEDSEGNKRYFTDVVASNVEFLDSVKQREQNAEINIENALGDMGSDWAAVDEDDALPF